MIKSRLKAIRAGVLACNNNAFRNPVQQVGIGRLTGLMIVHGTAQVCEIGCGLVALCSRKPMVRGSPAV